MKFKKDILCILSIILTMTMFIGSIPVLGASSTSMSAGSGSYTASGANAQGCKWTDGRQFLRISLFMTPRGEETDNLEVAPNLDWSSTDVSQLGKTFDWSSEGPSANVVYHSNFINAKEYYEKDYDNKITDKVSYLDQGRTFQIGKKLKTNWGTEMDFPKPVDNSQYQGQYVKDYFSIENSREVMNEVLWMVKVTAGQTVDNGTGIGGLNVDWIDGGYFIDDFGQKQRVSYLLIVEPGIYAYVHEKMSAYTLRDAIAWRKNKTDAVDSVNPLSNDPIDCLKLSLALTLEGNTDYGSIGLSRGGTESNDKTKNDLTKVRDDYNGGAGTWLSRYMGVGTSIFWGKGKPFEDPYPPLPIISYYYDSDDVYIDEAGNHMVSNPTDDDTDSNEGVQTNYELLSNPAHISKIDGKVGTVKIPMVSTEYTPKPVDVKVEYVDENNKVIDKVTISEDEVEETLKNLNQNEKLEYYRDNNEDSVYKLRGLILLNTTADYGIGEIGAGGEKYRGCIGLTANSDKAIFNLEDKSGNIVRDNGVFSTKAYSEFDKYKNGDAGYNQVPLVGEVDNKVRTKFNEVTTNNDVNSIAAVAALADDPSNFIVTTNKDFNDLISITDEDAMGNVKANFITDAKLAGDIQCIALYANYDLDCAQIKTVYIPKYTYVTKYLYENINSTVPISVTSSILDESEVYSIEANTVDDKNNKYQLVEWMNIDDLEDGPDKYDTYELAAQHINGWAGTTSGGWSLDEHPGTELCIKYVGAQPTPTPTPDTTTEDISNDVILAENRITKHFDLNDIGGVATIKFTYPTISGYETHRKKHKNHYHTKSCYENIYAGRLKFVESQLNTLTDYNSVLVNGNDNFRQYDTNNTYTFTRGKSGGTVSINDNYNYIVWRGDNKPTIAKYKYGSNSAGVISDLISTGNANESGYAEQKSYRMPFNFEFSKAYKDTNGNTGDYTYNTKWGYCGKVTTYSNSITSNSKKYTSGAQVQVYTGEINIGNDAPVASNENIVVNGVTMGNASGTPILENSAIQFYPYVRMLYDIDSKNNTSYANSVYVLGGDLSYLTPRDYIEVGYKAYGDDSKGTKTGLLVESQQWSTHASAIKLAKNKGFTQSPTNSVLPGGAIYRLRTPNDGMGKSNRTQVGVNHYLTFIPSDVVKSEAITAGGGLYDLDSQLARKDGLLHQIKRSLNSLDIIQIAQDKSGNDIALLRDKSGAKVGASGAELSFNDNKYWLNQRLIDGEQSDAGKILSKASNDADLDITNHTSKVTYYRIASDTDGNVIVTKGNSESATKPKYTTNKSGSNTYELIDSNSPNKVAFVPKDKSASDLIGTNAELQNLDAKTKLITNYFNAIDRNKGSDDNKNTWYNEAFDGICIVVIEDLIEVGINDNASDLNSAARTAVIDPKLQPVRSSQSDLYGSAIKSYFRTRSLTNIALGKTAGYNIESHGKEVRIPNWDCGENGYLGTYVYTSKDDKNNPIERTAQIILPNMEGLYRSKDFIIPNVSVMDLF